MVKVRKGTIHKAVNPSSGRIISVEGAKKKAWDALAKYVRTIEPSCITCGGRTTEAGHYLHNSDKKNKQLGGNLLWYEIRNIHGQCGTCNRWKSGAGAIYGAKLEARYGEGIITELYRLFNAPKKWTIPELLEIEALYKQKLKELEY